MLSSRLTLAWRTGWMLNCCSLRNADDFPLKYTRDWEARLAEFHYFTDCWRTSTWCFPVTHYVLCVYSNVWAVQVPSTAVGTMSGTPEHLLSSWDHKHCWKTKLCCPLIWYHHSLVYLQDWPSKLQCCRLERRSSLPEWISLMVDDIMSLLSMCLDVTFLSLGVKVYQQVQGTAMGSPASVVVTNLMMEDIEERALSTFHSTPCFWKRYVDDTCTALHPDLTEAYHDHLNSTEPCVQFTV